MITNKSNFRQNIQFISKSNFCFLFRVKFKLKRNFFVEKIFLKWSKKSWIINHSIPPHWEPNLMTKLCHNCRLIRFFPGAKSKKNSVSSLNYLELTTVTRNLFVCVSIGSPGPGAYPKDEGKKGNLIPKSLYPDDKAFKYSMGVRG